MEEAWILLEYQYSLQIFVHLAPLQSLMHSTLILITQEFPATNKNNNCKA